MWERVGMKHAVASRTLSMSAVRRMVLFLRRVRSAVGE